MDRKEKLRQLSALAESDEDIRLIEQIEQSRQEIMRGKRRGGKRSGPNSNPELRDLRLDGCILRLNMQTAPAAIDTIIDLWIDNAHMSLPMFQGAANRTVIDIGANEGFYSLRMKRQNSFAKMVAVEPVEATYARLATNIALNSCHDMYLLQGAVDKEDAPIRLQRHTTVPTVSSKDVEALGQNWIKRESLREELVQGYKLDSLMQEYSGYGFDEIDLIKIDVEGGELAVLQGGRETLAKTLRVVLEWHTPQMKRAVEAFLEAQGFRLLWEEQHRFGDLYFERKR